MTKSVPLPYSGGSYIVTQGFNEEVSHFGALKWGVDFAVPYGTAVYPIVSGDIVAFRQSVGEEFIQGPPNTLIDGDLYASAGSGHGNYVTVRSFVDGQEIFVTYAHMAPNFLETALGISAGEGGYGAGQIWGRVNFGEPFGDTGATGLRLSSLDEEVGASRGQHLHVHLGTSVVEFSGSEFVSDGSNDVTLPIYYAAFGKDSSDVPNSPDAFSTPYFGADYSLFSDANDENGGTFIAPEETISFAGAANEFGVASGSDVAELYLQSILGGAISNVTYTGSENAAFLVKDFEIPGVGIDFEGGVLLSSGGFPGPSNTSTDFSVSHNAPGDSDLSAVARDAFDGAGESLDASVLEFDIFVDDPDVDGIRFDIVFGSDEYPEFSNTSVIDVAAVFVNGSNAALFNGDPSTPLSVIDENLALNFVDNTSGVYPIEWDGFGALSVRPDLEQGQNSIKIAVSDTGDYILDSAIYVTNFELLLDGATGEDIFKVVNGVVGQNALVASETKEEFNLAAGTGSVAGELKALDGDVITGFTDQIKLIIEKVKLLKEWLTVTSGSAILDIDEDGDGDVDGTITLEGDFEGAEFNVEVVGDNSEITVEFATVNAPPIALDDMFTVSQNSALSGNVLDDNGSGSDFDPDGDNLSVSLVSGPMDGVLSLNPDGTFSYEAKGDLFDLAAPGEIVEQSFVYQIDDGRGGVEQATASIQVSIGESETIEVNSHIEFDRGSFFVNSKERMLLSQELHKTVADGENTDGPALFELNRAGKAEQNKDWGTDSSVDIVDVAAFTYDMETGLQDTLVFVDRDTARDAGFGADLNIGDVIKQEVNSYASTAGFGAAFGVRDKGKGTEGGYGPWDQTEDERAYINENEVLFFELKSEQVVGTGAAFSLDLASEEMDIVDVTVDFWTADSEGHFSLIGSDAAYLSNGGSASVEASQVFDAVSFRSSDPANDMLYRIASLEISTIYADDILG
ncbi:choice-of-anchor L domain-containing protein [Shimia sp.]|uniref:choice-of-anchor L domain-containing protein n=1 Tax=Shimia sp. TaxID=1954381 RepID=UPI003BAAFA02